MARTYVTDPGSTFLFLAVFDQQASEWPVSDRPPNAVTCSVLVCVAKVASRRGIVIVPPGIVVHFCDFLSSVVKDVLELSHDALLELLRQPR